MNNVELIGRLTRDPDVRYSQGDMCVARFSVAIDRPTKADEEKKTDFPRVVAFGKIAENIEKHIGKGCRVGVVGRLQTGSYEDKNGNTVYTTDVIATRVEFIDFKDSKESEPSAPSEPAPGENFDEVDEDVPF